MNFVPVRKEGPVVHFPNGQSANLGGDTTRLSDGEYRAGFRAHHLEVAGDSAEKPSFEAKLIATELTGSDTYIHVEALGERWIGLVPGLKTFQVGELFQIRLNPGNLLYFDQSGKSACPPGAETRNSRA